MDIKNNLLAKVIRENTVESFHQGHIAVVDKRGQLRYALGDPNFFTFIRSAAKPLQAISVIESGAAENYGLANEEIALMCASHTGEQSHVAVGQGILKKLGLTENALRCGTHFPKDIAATRKLLAEGKEPGTLHNNCSGKHLGMLTLALHGNNSIVEYIERNHPVQQDMLRNVAKYCHLTLDSFELGTDGCGVPVFAMPIFNMALAYAEMAAKSKSEQAPKRIVESMLEFPDLIAGTDQLCTDLMSVTKGKLIAKVGTEAIYCIGLLKEELGIAIKITDGSARALGPVVINILSQLGILSLRETEQLAKWHTIQLTNHRQESIGKIVSSFALVPN